MRSFRSLRFESLESRQVLSSIQAIITNREPANTVAAVVSNPRATATIEAAVGTSHLAGRGDGARTPNEIARPFQRGHELGDQHDDEEHAQGLVHFPIVLGPRPSAPPTLKPCLASAKNGA